MPYEAEISRSNPTAFVFLVDQSGSMADKLSTAKVHIPTQAGHPFRLKAATHSEAKRPPIPTRRRPLFDPFSE